MKAAIFGSLSVVYGCLCLSTMEKPYMVYHAIKGVEAYCLTTKSFKTSPELDQKIRELFGLYGINSEYFSDNMQLFIIEAHKSLILAKHSLATVNAQENNLSIPSEPPLPFETSENLHKVLRTESPPTVNGKTAITQFSERQQQTLRFDATRLELKVKAVRAIEEEKRETNRQSHFRRATQPVQDDICDTFQQPCPLGHNKNYCFNSVGHCDRRGQCYREGIIKGNMFDFGENPAPFTPNTA